MLDATTLVRAAMAAGGVCYAAYLIRNALIRNRGPETSTGRLDRLRLWCIAIAFASVVPLWASAYLKAPVWVVVVFVVLALLGAVAFFVISLMVGWRQGKEASRRE